MIEVIYEKPSNRIPPAEFLQRAADSMPELSHLDLKIVCEPRYEPDMVYWAFDNYRIKGNVSGPPKKLFYTQPGWGQYFETQYGRYNIQCQSYAIDPDFHKPVDMEPEYEVGFVGQLDGDDRPEYIDKLKENFKVHISDSVSNEELPKVLSNCKILFNHIRTEEVNIRFFEAMALGAQVVTHAPALHMFATEGEHYISIKSSDEMVEEIKKLLADDGRRREIARKARQHVLEHHTYKHRLLSMLKFLDLYE